MSLFRIYRSKFSSMISISRLNEFGNIYPSVERKAFGIQVIHVGGGNEQYIKTNNKIEVKDTEKKNICSFLARLGK